MSKTKEKETLQDKNYWRRKERFYIISRGTQDSWKFVGIKRNNDKISTMIGMNQNDVSASCMVFLQIRKNQIEYSFEAIDERPNTVKSQTF